MSYGLPSYIILAQLVAALTPLVEAAEPKGEVVPAHDPAEALDYLSNAPSKYRVIVGVDDEGNAEAGNHTGSTGTSLTQFFTIVQVAPGLSVKPGKEVYARSDGKASILEIAEAVRAWMRGLRFTHDNIDCQAGFVWQGSTWVSTKAEGKLLQYGRQHVFRLEHQISNPALLAPIAIVHPTA